MNCSNPECGNTLLPHQPKYCSRSCSAKVNNRKHPKRRKSERICNYCGEAYSGRGSLFCSTRCHRSHREENWAAEWRQGIYDPSSPVTGELSQRAKKYLIKNSSYRCSECGWGEPNPVLGYPILTIDHVDGDWRNNAYSNLKVLCFNCHTLTPTFGALNRGTGSPRSKTTRKVWNDALEPEGTAPRS